jgi:hypothetical protein
MVLRLAAALLLVSALHGCVVYEYEHEIWLQVDGSGTVHLTGRPGLWTAFKGLPLDEDDPDGMVRAARALFESSGLEVTRARVVTRRGSRFLFVAARFRDVNRISYTPALPDLRVGLRREGGRLHLDGSWQRPLHSLAGGEQDAEGLVAVRFHLPSKVYRHRRAADGVERGNILGWRQETAAALDGGRLEFGAEMDERSILLSTVMLFAGAVALAALLLAAALWAAMRQGRKDLEAEDPRPRGAPGPRV